MGEGGWTPGEETDSEKSESETICGARCCTSLPCLRLPVGGGGFFFLSGLRPSPIRLELSSSSVMDNSYDVLGDSSCGSCTGSNMDCLETEEVSVLLLLSPPIPLCDRWWVETDGTAVE